MRPSEIVRRAPRRCVVLLLALLAPLLHQGCGEIRLTGSGQGKVGTFFFFWHDCQPNAKPTATYPYRYGPEGNCPQDEMIYHPPAMSGGRTFRYSSQELRWYMDELQAMKRAGIDVIFPVYWGEHPLYPFFRVRNVALLVQAIDLLGSDIKIGLFDDTSSQVSQANYDKKLDYAPRPAMNLADESQWHYFYEGKVQPFFRTVPKRLWATHNGASVEDGGRPIVITWIAEADPNNPNGPSFFSFHGAAASLFHWVKERFEGEFGVEPFLVFESSWYDKAPDLDTTGDAQYSWGAAAFHSIWHIRNDYIISSVGPGYDDHLVPSRRSSPRIRPRNVTHDESGAEHAADPLAFFRNEYLLDRPVPNWPNHGVHPLSDLVLIETWNELFEGTSISPMIDYPDLEHPGQLLPEDTYVQALRELKRDRPGYRDYDHTIVSAAGSPGGTWTLEIRNDGALTWKKGSVHLGYRIHDAAGNLLHEGKLADLNGDTAFGESQILSFPQPPEWTDTGRFAGGGVVIDMQADGTWFTELGDSFLIRGVASVFPGFF